MFSTDAVMGLVRHLLTTGGGFLAAKGIVASSQVEPLVGAVLVLIGVAWSVINKKKA